ncbi:hypothetical protein J6590_036531 [Homalodisca vitripennis]|nr:hypothetical protein J6590_036531 [Homalodisca vitripennis]
MESRGKLLAMLDKIVNLENETVAESDLFRNSSDDDIVLPASESDVNEDYFPNPNVNSDDDIVLPTSESDLFSSDGEEEYIPNLNDISSDDDFILPHGKFNPKVRQPQHLNTDLPQLDLFQANDADSPVAPVEDERNNETKRKKKIFQLP